MDVWLALALNGFTAGRGFAIGGLRVCETDVFLGLLVFKAEWKSLLGFI